MLLLNNLTLETILVYLKQKSGKKAILKARNEARTAEIWKAKTKTAIIFLPIALMMLQSCCRGGWCSMAGASELASDAVGHVYLNRLTS